MTNVQLWTTCHAVRGTIIVYYATGGSTDRYIRWNHGVL